MEVIKDVLQDLRIPFTETADGIAYDTTAVYWFQVWAVRDLEFAAYAWLRDGTRVLMSTRPTTIVNLRKRLCAAFPMAIVPDPNCWGWVDNAVYRYETRTDRRPVKRVKLVLTEDEVKRRRRELDAAAEMRQNSFYEDAHLWR